MKDASCDPRRDRVVKFSDPEHQADCPQFAGKGGSNTVPVAESIREEIGGFLQLSPSPRRPVASPASNWTEGGTSTSREREHHAEDEGHPLAGLCHFNRAISQGSDAGATNPRRPVRVTWTPCTGRPVREGRSRGGPKSSQWILRPSPELGWQWPRTATRGSR